MSAKRLITIEISGSRVRVTAAGQMIAQSDKALVLREQGHDPVYYLPPADVRRELLSRSAHTSHCPYKGDATYWTLESGPDRMENLAWTYESPKPAVSRIAGYFAFYPDRADLEIGGAGQAFVLVETPVDEG